MTTLQELAEILETASHTCANPACDNLLTDLGETYCSQRCEDEHTEWSRELASFYADDQAGAERWAK